MKTFFSEEHRRHFPQAELSGGEFVTPYERPSRVEYVLGRLKERGLTDIVDPGAPDMAAIRALCAPDYLALPRDRLGRVEGRRDGAARSSRRASPPAACRCPARRATSTAKRATTRSRPKPRSPAAPGPPPCPRPPRHSRPRPMSQAAPGPLSRFAVHRGTTPPRTCTAATASSTTRPSSPRPSAATAQDAWRSSISTSTTATALRTSSTTGGTCSSPRSTAHPRTPSPISSASRTRPARARAKARR